LRHWPLAVGATEGGSPEGGDRDARHHRKTGLWGRSKALQALVPGRWAPDAALLLSRGEEPKFSSNGWRLCRGNSIFPLASGSRLRI